MILIAHLLFGALIGEKISNPFLAVVLAFLGHYFLDLFPHIDYPIENSNKRQWRPSTHVILRVGLDLLLAILLILVFSNNQPIIYICAFFSILPDGLTALQTLFPNNTILKKHRNWHTGTLHFLKHKKISVFWRIFSQVAVVVICAILLKI